MTSITFVVPTHDHGPLLERAVASILAQTVTDFDVVIVGDGVDEVTRRVAQRAVADDGRIRFLDLPKAPRLGESHRHRLLTSGEVAPNICYVSDDDLLLPFHGELVLDALNDVDLVAAMTTWVRVDGQVAYEAADLGRDDYRRWLISSPRTSFGLTGLAHTLEAYLKLPHGWRTTPAGIGTDHYMSIQFVEQPWLRARTLSGPSIVHFPSSPRRDWTMDERVEEIDGWAAALRQPGFMDSYHEAVRIGMREAAVNHLIRERWWELGASHEAALVSEATAWNADLQEALERAMTWSAGVERELAAEHDRRRALDREVSGLQAALGQSYEEIANLSAGVIELRAHAARVEAAEERFRAQLDAMERSRTWRLRTASLTRLRAIRRGAR